VKTDKPVVSISVVRVEKEKTNTRDMALEILSRSNSGTALSEAECRVVADFMDPSFDTDDISLVEEFIRIYENATTGRYQQPAIPTPKRTEPEGYNETAESSSDSNSPSL